MNTPITNYNMMKKIIITFCLCSFMLTSYGQKTQSDDYYKGIEYYENLKLTTEQKSSIKKVNQEMASQFAAIGKDRTLSGYEKGQKKRALSIKKQEAIQKILTENQKKIWEDGVKANSDKASSGDTTLRKSISDKYDSSLDKLNDKYEADKDKIENNQNLTKEEKKAQTKALKEAYKIQKEKMKKEKKEVKDNL